MTRLDPPILVQSVERANYFEEMVNDLRYGFRQLMSKPALPLMIIVLLAIGVGANTAIFSVVKAVLLEPLPFEASDQLVIFWETEDGSGRSPASYPNFLDWREQAESFEDIGVITYWHFNLTGEQGPEYRDSTDVQRFYDELIERVEALPGVRSAAATSKLPLQGGSNSDINKADGHDFSQGQTPFAEISVITRDYFQTMGIPLLKGRLFDDHDDLMSDLNPAVINHAMVERLWPNEDPIGKHFEWFAPYSMTVIGVVGDVRQWGPEREAHPEIYMPLSTVPEPMQFTFKTVRFLIVRTDEDPLSLVAAVRQEVARVDPHQPISDIRTTADVLSSTLARRRFNTLLIGIFATIALILIAAGIYGVMSFFVAQRTHEIGIRVAMGASWSGVQKLVLGHGLKLAAIGIVVGLVGVFATTKLTESMVYGVSPTDPATLIAGIVFLVGCGTSWFPITSTSSKPSGSYSRVERRVRLRWIGELSISTPDR